MECGSLRSRYHIDVSFRTHQSPTTAHQPQSERRLEPSCKRSSWYHRDVVRFAALDVEQIAPAEDESQAAEQLARRRCIDTRDAGIRAPEVAQLLTDNRTRGRRRSSGERA